MKTLALIPHYNHPTTISHVAQTMRGFGLNVLIVDDGSREECKPVLQALVSEGIDVLYRPINGGKGAAVKPVWNTLKNMAIPTFCRLMQTASIA